MYSLQDASQKIFEIVDNSPDKTILGQHLGFLMRQSLHEFHPMQHQVRNLRHFIKQYVPRVTEKGRSGMDVIYTTAAPSHPPLSEVTAENTTASHPLGFVPLPTGLYEWKAYSNPSYPFVLAANRDTGEWKTFPQNVPVTTPWLVIPKPSKEFHKELANQFVSTLQEPTRTMLRGMLSDPKWYVHFSSAARQNGVGTQWAAFRRSKLVAKFDETLRAVGLPSPQQPLSQRVATPSPEPGTGAPKWTSRGAISDEGALRELVKRVVAEMPTSELRLLRLPVGIVFDIVSR